MDAAENPVAAAHRKREQQVIEGWKLTFNQRVATRLKQLDDERTMLRSKVAEIDQARELALAKINYINGAIEETQLLQAALKEDEEHEEIVIGVGTDQTPQTRDGEGAAQPGRVDETAEGSVGER